MSTWDLTSDDGQTTAHEHAKTPDEKAMRWPQAYSTMLGAHGKESCYSTRENGGIDSVMEVDVRVSEKTYNGLEKETWNWTGMVLKEDSQS